MRLAAGGEKVTVTVEDNGMGISAADLPHIFGRFYRADPSRSQVEGSGLGLSIAMWIANVHQATLSADSRENAGSVFKIVFPLLAVNCPPPKTAPAADSLTSVGLPLCRKHGPGYPAVDAASRHLAGTGGRSAVSLTISSG